MPAYIISSLVISQGIWTIIAKKFYIFVNFRGGGGSGSPVPHSGSAHEPRVLCFPESCICYDKGADQAAHMHRLACACVVHMQKIGFLETSPMLLCSNSPTVPVYEM